jgi:hypothetical protein
MNTQQRGNSDMPADLLIAALLCAELPALIPLQPLIVCNLDWMPGSWNTECQILDQ